MLPPTRIRPRLYDIDRAGVVFFATFYRYCQDALEDLVAQLYERPLEESFAAGLWAMPVVRSTADYRHPLRLGEPCLVHLRVAQLSQRSLRLAYRIERDPGPLCAEIEITHAFVDPQTGRACAVPAAFRAGLARLGLYSPDA